jgi:N6-L-threonylcarbamoyladenine synthase
VAANKELRQQFDLNLKSENLNLDFLVPPKNLCTDNAAMVAVAGYFNRRKATRDYQKIRADANLRLS